LSSLDEAECARNKGAPTRRLPLDRLGPTSALATRASSSLSVPSSSSSPLLDPASLLLELDGAGSDVMTSTSTPSSRSGLIALDGGGKATKSWAAEIGVTMLDVRSAARTAERGLGETGATTGGTGAGGDGARGGGGDGDGCAHKVGGGGGGAGVGGARLGAATGAGGLGRAAEEGSSGAEMAGAAAGSGERDVGGARSKETPADAGAT